MTPPSSQSHERPSSIWVRPPAKAVGVAPERIDPELPLVGERACGHEALEIGEPAAVARSLPLWGLGDRVDGLARPVLAGRGELFCAASQSSVTARCSPISIRALAWRATAANAPQPSPEGTTFAPE